MHKFSFGNAWNMFSKSLNILQPNALVKMLERGHFKITWNPNAVFTPNHTHTYIHPQQPVGLGPRPRNGEDRHLFAVLTMNKIANIAPFTFCGESPTNGDYGVLSFLVLSWYWVKVTSSSGRTQTNEKFVLHFCSSVTLGNPVADWFSWNHAS